jgi:hypothetical protein
MLRPLDSIIGVSGILDRPPEPVIGRRFAPTWWRAMTSESVVHPLGRHCEAKQSMEARAKEGGLLRRKCSSQ